MCVSRRRTIDSGPFFIGSEISSSLPVTVTPLRDFVSPLLQKSSHCIHTIMYVQYHTAETFGENGHFGGKQPAIRHVSIRIILTGF